MQGACLGARLWACLGAWVDPWTDMLVGVVANSVAQTEMDSNRRTISDSCIVDEIVNSLLPYNGFDVVDILVSSSLCGSATNHKSQSSLLELGSVE